MGSTANRTIAADRPRRRRALGEGPTGGRGQGYRLRTDWAVRTGLCLPPEAGEQPSGHPGAPPLWTGALRAWGRGTFLPGPEEMLEYLPQGYRADWVRGQPQGNAIHGRKDVTPPTFSSDFGGGRGWVCACGQ